MAPLSSSAAPYPELLECMGFSFPSFSVLYNPVISDICPIGCLFCPSFLILPLSFSSHPPPSSPSSSLTLLFSLLSWPGLVYWPCLICVFLPLLQALPDASHCALPHIYSEILPPNQALKHSCLYFIHVSPCEET